MNNNSQHAEIQNVAIQLSLESSQVRTRLQDGKWSEYFFVLPYIALYQVHHYLHYFSNSLIHSFLSLTACLLIRLISEIICTFFAESARASAEDLASSVEAIVDDKAHDPLVNNTHHESRQSSSSPPMSNGTTSLTFSLYHPDTAQGSGSNSFFPPTVHVEQRL